MAKKFDASLKHLLDGYPADWVRLTGHIPTGPISVVDTDLSTVSLAADKLYLIEEAIPWMLYLEMQSDWDDELPARLAKYNLIAGTRFGLPVRSVVLLLRPAAEASILTGCYERFLPDGGRNLAFNYDVIRLWQISATTLLLGGLGTLPLAPLALTGSQELPDVVRRMDERIRNESAPTEAGELMTAATVLLGLRFSVEMISQLIRGITEMESSVTYQAILSKGIEKGIEKGIVTGRVVGVRTTLYLVGTKRFGPPSGAIRAVLEATTDADKLEDLVKRSLDVASWDELIKA